MGEGDAVTSYTCVGPVRGSCGHTHDTLRDAIECLDRDRKACRELGGGSYSDRRVRRDGDQPLTQDDQDEYDDSRAEQDDRAFAKDGA